MKFDKRVLSCFQPLFSVQSLVSKLYIKSSDNDVTCYTDSEAPVLFLPLCDPYEVFCSLSSDSNLVIFHPEWSLRLFLFCWTPQ